MPVADYLCEINDARNKVKVFDCLDRKLITWEKPNKDIKLDKRYRLYYKQSHQRQALVRAITWATSATVDEFPEHLRLEYEGKFGRTTLDSWTIRSDFF